MKKLIIATALFATGLVQAAAPTIGWQSVTYTIGALRFDAKEKVVWFTGTQVGSGDNNTYYFQYVYASSPNPDVPAPESGNSLDQARTLLSALSLAKSTNKTINFEVIRGPNASRYVFSSVQVNP